MRALGQVQYAFMELSRPADAVPGSANEHRTAFFAHALALEEHLLEGGSELAWVVERARNPHHPTRGAHVLAREFAFGG